MTAQPMPHHGHHRGVFSWGDVPSVPYDVHSPLVVRLRPRSCSDLERDQDEQGWKRNQLTAMVLAMGGPGFPHHTTSPSTRDQKSNCDNVQAFAPLLEECLKMGDNVDDAASFADFFWT